LVTLFGSWWTSRTMDANSEVVTSVLSARTALAAVMSIPVQVLALSFLLTVLMLVLRTIGRGDRVAVALLILLGAAVGTQDTPWAGASLGLLSGITLIRFGRVAVFAAFFTGSAISVLRAALVWNNGADVLILAAIAALTLGAAYIAMGSPRPSRVTGSAV